MNRAAAWKNLCGLVGKIGDPVLRREYFADMRRRAIGEWGFDPVSDKPAEIKNTDGIPDDVRSNLTADEIEHIRKIRQIPKLRALGLADKAIRERLKPVGGREPLSLDDYTGAELKALRMVGAIDRDWIPVMFLDETLLALQEWTCANRLASDVNPAVIEAADNLIENLKGCLAR
jgi:hypothetical protein